MRDKSQDDVPGGSDQRFDKIEKMIERGQYKQARRAIKQVNKELDRTDSVQKRNVRSPKLLKQIEYLESGGDKDVIAIATRRVFAEEKRITREQWNEIDGEAWKMVCKQMAVHADEETVKNDVTDTLGRKYDIFTGPERDRLVRKVFDHVEAWLRMRKDEDDTA